MPISMMTTRPQASQSPPPLSESQGVLLLSGAIGQPVVDCGPLDSTLIGR